MGVKPRRGQRRSAVRHRPNSATSEPTLGDVLSNVTEISRNEDHPESTEEPGDKVVPTVRDLIAEDDRQQLRLSCICGG